MRTKRPSLLNRDAWQLQQNGLLLLSAPPPEQALSGPEIILHTPSVWLQVLCLILSCAPHCA